MLQVTQVAAQVHGDEAQRFSRYILPQGNIGAKARHLTGLEKDGLGRLLLRGVPVDTVPRRAAVQGLLDFLRGLNAAAGAAVPAVPAADRREFHFV